MSDKATYRCNRCGFQTCSVPEFEHHVNACIGQLFDTPAPRCEMSDEQLDALMDAPDVPYTGCMRHTWPDEGEPCPMCANEQEREPAQPQAPFSQVSAPQNLTKTEPAAEPPREWTIGLDSSGRVMDERRVAMGMEAVHVIEKSAYDEALRIHHATLNEVAKLQRSYDALKAERDLLAKKFANADMLLGEHSAHVDKQEREIARLSRELEGWKTACDVTVRERGLREDLLVAERDAARAEVERLKGELILSRGDDPSLVTYGEIQAERDQLRSENEHYRVELKYGPTRRALWERKEIESLTAERDRLKAALERIAADFGTDACDGNTMIAHEALKGNTWATNT